MNKNESGRSLIEMLAVLGIIATISIGIISGVRWGLVSSGSFKLQSDVESAGQELQELCAWEDVWKESCDDTNELDSWPESLSIFDFDNDHLILRAANVPQRVCRRLLNPAYTTWADDIVAKIRTTKKGDVDIIIPMNQNDHATWQTACNATETMDFYIIK